MSNSAPLPDPQLPRGTQVLDTVAAQVAAIDTLIALARKTLRVFDTDLSQMGWNAPGRAAALSAFLRSSQDARVQIIVHDTRWLESACPRLLAVYRQWTTSVTIYRTGEAARAVMDPLVIVDDVHFLHRFHRDQPRATLAIDEPTLARPLVRRFEEIWATGESGIGATVLGL